MFTSLFLTIGLIHLIALASPGPDFALILRTSLHRPTALGAALGIALAILLHATLSLTGISLLIASQPWLFLAVKLVGALYLGWLGWGALKAAWQGSGDLALRAGGERPGWRKGVKSGLATNLLNPKALLFCSVLLPQFIDPHGASVTAQFATLGAILVAVGLAFDSGYGLAGARIGRWLQRSPSAQRLQQWLFGSLLIGFAIRLTFVQQA